MTLINLESEDSNNFNDHTIPWDTLFKAAQSHEYASDLTHPLYLYPARMSPHLARTIIKTFTQVGDVVLDPFSGGGTTAIEALYHGRKAICGDLNVLACFITHAKAWPVSKTSLKNYSMWAKAEINRLYTFNISVSANITQDSISNIYDAPYLQTLLREIRDRTADIKDSNSRRLALLTILRVGQICFDCRQTPPTIEVLGKAFNTVTQLIIQKMNLYATACRQYFKTNSQHRLRIYNTDAETLSNYIKEANMGPVSLILTSPPYLGVKVLYHRWQIGGRKQTDLPYELANLNNDYFGSHYTFGVLTQTDKSYFEKLRTIFTSLRKITTPSTIVAQIIGFTDSQTHIENYRRVMLESGFRELTDPSSPKAVISRIIPHRRWYTRISKEKNNRLEYLFIHRAIDK